MNRTKKKAILHFVWLVLVAKARQYYIPQAVIVLKRLDFWVTIDKHQMCTCLAHNNEKKIQNGKYNAWERTYINNIICQECAVDWQGLDFYEVKLLLCAGVLRTLKKIETGHFRHSHFCEQGYFLEIQWDEHCLTELQANYKYSIWYWQEKKITIIHTLFQ